MARTGHNFPNRMSGIKKPIVIGPAYLPPRIEVTLSASLARTTQAPTRRTRYWIGKPVVVQKAIAPDSAIISTSAIGTTISPQRAVVPSAITATSTIGQISIGGQPSPSSLYIRAVLRPRRHSGSWHVSVPTIVASQAPPPQAVVVGIRATLVSLQAMLTQHRMRVMYTRSVPVTNATTSPLSLDQQRLKAKLARKIIRGRSGWVPPIPMLVNPTILLTVQLRQRLALVATGKQNRRVFSQRFSPAVRSGQIVIGQASITATSNVTASIGAVRALTFSAINSTSTIATVTVRNPRIVPASVNATSAIVTVSIGNLVPVSGSINAISPIFATISGGTGGGSTTRRNLVRVGV